MLPQYGPDLLAQCKNVCDLSELLVAGWLEKYMFAGDPEAKAKATDIASWLSKHSEHKLHGRHLPRDLLEAKGMKIEHLESDQTVQDLCLSVFHATTHTFSHTSAVKVIENNLGRAFIKQVRIVQAMAPIVEGNGQPAQAGSGQANPPAKASKGKTKKAKKATGRT
jgi:hypothetical protein